MTSIEYFNNAGDTTPAKTVTFGLDNNGNILSVIDDAVQSTAFYDYIYDALNRVDNFTNNLVNKVLDYDYDAFGNRNKLTLKEGATPIYTIDYSYNKLEQLININAPSGTTSFDYLPTGRLETKTFPNGVQGNYTYFDNGDLLALTYASGTATPLLALSYTYDDAHNVDTKTLDSTSYDYNYDNIYQLTNVKKNEIMNESFSYDTVGNRMTSGPSSPLLSYSYDNNNQLNSYNGVSFSYDDNGNTTTKTDVSGTTLYNYSIDDRLLTVNTPTISASYEYGPMGRRISKTVNGTDILYLWDQNVLLAELDSSGNILKSYLYNSDNNEPISVIENANTYFYLNDHLMTPQKMVDGSGTIVWGAEYKAFGEVAVDPSSTITNNLRFPGQYFDEENGLYYNYLRYYDPGIGKYMRVDPLEFYVDSSTNLYLYVTNNPLKYFDPLGLNRYKACEIFSGARKWFCKKSIDWRCGSSFPEGAYCCDMDKTNCIEDIGLCDDFAEKVQECTAEYTKCVARLGE